METTVAHEEGISIVVNRAYGYSREGSSWHRTDQSNTSAVLGDGGIYTSVDELVNWIRALDGGQFAEASVPRVDTATAGVRYGFGWRISEHAGPAGGRAYGRDERLSQCADPVPGREAHGRPADEPQ